MIDEQNDASYQVRVLQFSNQHVLNSLSFLNALKIFTLSLENHLYPKTSDQDIEI